ncbi:hypothetical protein GW17_00035420 [Ensete ventricosum]|nr:hypothetical protein GW17_00035420 [Ensete ventricosum]
MRGLGLVNAFGPAVGGSAIRIRTLKPLDDTGAAVREFPAWLLARLSGDKLCLAVSSSSATYLHALDSATVAGEVGEGGVGLPGDREGRGGLETGERRHHAGLSRRKPGSRWRRRTASPRKPFHG